MEKLEKVTNKNGIKAYKVKDYSFVKAENLDALPQELQELVVKAIRKEGGWISPLKIETLKVETLKEYSYKDLDSQYYLTIRVKAVKNLQGELFHFVEYDDRWWVINLQSIITHLQNGFEDTHLDLFNEVKSMELKPLEYYYSIDIMEELEAHSLNGVQILKDKMLLSGYIKSLKKYKMDFLRYMMYLFTVEEVQDPYWGLATGYAQYRVSGDKWDGFPFIKLKNCEFSYSTQLTYGEGTLQIQYLNHINRVYEGYVETLINSFKLLYSLDNWETLGEEAENSPKGNTLEIRGDWVSPDELSIDCGEDEYIVIWSETFSVLIQKYDEYWMPTVAIGSGYRKYAKIILKALQKWFESEDKEEEVEYIHPDFVKRLKLKLKNFNKANYKFKIKVSSGETKYWKGSIKYKNLVLFKKEYKDGCWSSGGVLITVYDNISPFPDN